MDFNDLLQVSTLPGLAKDIQLALAPVFLLTAIASLLNLLAGRLSRIVDRARWIEAKLTSDRPHDPRLISELRLLDRRMRTVNNAIFLCTASAVVLCTVVAAMFLARLAGFGFARTLSMAFALSLMMLIAGLVLFLIEVRMAVAAIRIRDDLLERQ
jgi:hypothetical protein